MDRILIVSHEFPPFLGGIGSLAHGLAVGAAAMGYDTHVLAPAYDADTSGWDADQPYGVSRFGGSTCSILSLDKLTRFSLRCRREIKLRRPRVIHGVDPAAQMALTALARLRLVREYFWTNSGSELLRYRDEGFPRAWMRNAFRKVTAVSTISRAVYEILVRDFDIEEGKAFVSHPGIAPMWFETRKANVAEARKRWGAATDDMVLLTVGRRVRDKGHQRVIEGLGELPADLRQRVVYWIVGGGQAEYARTLADAAISRSVRLRLLGTLADSDLMAAYDAADLYVMLSRATSKRLEGFGLVYLEAAARGLPSLACATGGVSEAVRDGNTGLLLPYYPSAAQVAHAVDHLLRAERVRQEMGGRAREFASTFTWTRNAAEVYGNFLKALDGHA